MEDREVGTREDAWAWGHLLLGPQALLAAVPWAYVGLSYGDAVRAALFLGRWPSFDNPDPKNLPRRISPTLDALPATSAALAFSLVAGLLVLAGLRSRRDRLPGRSVVIVVTSWILAYLVLAAGPLGVLERLMD